MKDNILTAHALRLAMHVWLRQHPDAGMARIVEAFSDTPQVTVRKSMQRLAAMGFAQRRGNGRASCYRAIGDAIYSIEAMRARRRTGQANLLHDYNRDRIALAWQVRRDIHALVVANPMIRMESILHAFSGLPINTVRKHVAALVKKGNLTLHGVSNSACYSAATAEIYSVDDVREKLRVHGRLIGAMPTSQHPAYQRQAAPEPAPKLDPLESVKYTNNPEDHRPHPYQGGQFNRGSLNGCSPLAGRI